MYAGDEEFYQEILLERGAVGTYIPAQSGSAYSEPVEFFGGQEIYEDFASWMTELPGIDNGDHTSENEWCLNIEGMKRSLPPGLFLSTFWILQKNRCDP